MTPGEQEASLISFYYNMLRDYDKAVEQTKKWFT
jgi:hypothetical protein